MGGLYGGTQCFYNLDLEVTLRTLLVEVVRSPPWIEGLGSIMVT